MVDAIPSPWRAGLCVVLAVGLALTLGLPLALTDYRYNPTGAGSLGYSCGTDSSLKVKGLPGVCLGAPWCNQSQCCPPADGRVVWLDPVPSDYTGGLIPPDVLEPRWEYDATLTANVDLITVWCSFDDANLPFYTIKLRCDTAAWGRFDKGGKFFSDNNILNIQIGGTNKSLKTGDPYGPLEVQLGLGQWWQFPRQVDMELYPDFKLPFALWFAAWWDKESNPNQKNVTAEQKHVYDSEPPVVVQLNFNYIPNFEVTDPGCRYTIEPDGTRTYGLEGLIQLSKAARVGVDTLNACMWTLAILSCAMSFLWCMLAKPRDHVHVDLMCFSGALLFAIPTMRGLLPAAPAAGTRYDVLNVYGQLLLVTISIGLQFFKMLFAVVHLERLRLRANFNANSNIDKSVVSGWVHCFTSSKCQQGAAPGPPAAAAAAATNPAAAPTAAAASAAAPAVQALAQAIAAALAANPAAAAALGPAPAAAAAQGTAGAAAAPAAPGPAPVATAGATPAPVAAPGPAAVPGLAAAAVPRPGPGATGATTTAPGPAALPAAAAGAAAAAAAPSETPTAAPPTVVSASPSSACTGSAVPAEAACRSDAAAAAIQPPAAEASSSTGSQNATRDQQQLVLLAKPWLPRVNSPPQRGRQAPQQQQQQQKAVSDQQQQVPDVDGMRDQGQHPTSSNSSAAPSGGQSLDDGA